MANSAFTVYTLGETTTFRTMIEGVALVFQDPFFSSNAALGLGYGAFFGALVLMCIMIYQAAFNQRMEIKTLIAPLFAYLVLTGPKVTIEIADVYNVDNPQRVSGIPIGLAFPLTIASGAAYVFTSAFEQSYSSPNSPRMLTDGFVTPLKTLNAIRYININTQTPYLSGMVRDVYSSCVKGNKQFNSEEYLNSPDSYRYFINFLTTQSSGVVNIIGVDGTSNLMSCKDSATRISTAFESFLYGDGSGGIDTLNHNFASVINESFLQTDSSGGKPYGVTAETFIADFSKLTNLSVEDGRMFIMNALFNQPLQTAAYCASKDGLEGQNEISSRCTEWVQANEQMAEDNAAGATGFLKVMQNGQNLLIIIALLMFPMVVMLIMFMGTKSMKIVTGYLTYIASVYLWVPMASIVNFVAHNKLKNAIYTFTGSETGDLFTITDYPSFYEAISNSLALANGLMASVPVFCMMFFGGMTMGVIALQNRWNQGKSQYADSTLAAPAIVSPSALATRQNSLTSHGLGGMTDVGGGKAFDSSMTRQMASTMSQTTELSAQRALLQAKNKALGMQLQQTHSQGQTGSYNHKIETNLNEVKDKTLIGQGNGFTISKGTVDSATFGRNGVLTAYGEVDSSGKIINLTGRDAAAVSARIGMGIGFIPAGKDLINADGSSGLDGANAQVVTAPEGETIKGGDLKLDLKRVKIELGASTKHSELLTISSQHGHTGSASVSNVLYQGSSSDQKSASKFVYVIEKDDKHSELTNGTRNTVENSVQNSISNTERLSQSNTEALSYQIAQNNKEIDSLNRQISETVSFAMSYNMTADDTMHRIAAHQDIRNDLGALNKSNQEKYGEEWTQARALAESVLVNSGTGIAKQSNPVEYDHMVTYIAAYYMGANNANEAFKILTGTDLIKVSETRLKAEDYDWQNWKDIEKEYQNQKAIIENAFGKGVTAPDGSSIYTLDPYTKQPVTDTTFNSNQPSALENQYRYSAGELKLLGDSQTQNGIRIYNAFLSAGFTPRQAKIMTVQVGRENSWQVAGMFGLHKDPLKTHLTNGGIISFNDTRKLQLDKWMDERGLIKSGSANGKASYQENQQSLIAMAQFIKHELEHGAKNYKLAWAALNNDNLSDQKIHDIVGDKYIVWARSVARYGDIAINGQKNIEVFTNKIDSALKNQGKMAGQQGASVPKNIVAAMKNVNTKDLGSTVIQPVQKVKNLVPENLLKPETLSKEEIQNIYEKNKAKYGDDAKDKIREQFGVDVIHDEDGKIDYKIVDGQKLLDKVNDRPDRSRIDEHVAKTVPMLLQVGPDHSTMVRGDINSANNIDRLYVKEADPDYIDLSNVKSNMKPRDPNDTSHHFGIRGEISNEEWRKLEQSQFEKNEKFQNDNIAVVNSIIAAAQKGKDYERPSTQERIYPTIHQTATEAHKEAFEKLNNSATKPTGSREVNTEKWNDAGGNQ